MRRFEAASSVPQDAISSSVRKHPVQKRPVESRTHTLMQGDGT
jgi:hypothetical protein